MSCSFSTLYTGVCVCVMCGKTWKDYRLTWNETSFSGLSHVYLSTSDIWIPDATLYNKSTFQLILYHALRGSASKVLTARGWSWEMANFDTLKIENRHASTNHQKLSQVITSAIRMELHGLRINLDNSGTEIQQVN